MNKVSNNEVIFNGVLSMLNTKQAFVGTMTDLNRKLTRIVGKRNLPKSPSALRVVLNQVVNRLRNQGVSVKFHRANDRIRTRLVKLVTR